MEYFAIIEKEPQSCYGASCPDYPGVIGAGDSVQEAAEDLEKAIRFYLEDKPVAKASSLEAVKAVERQYVEPDAITEIVKIRI